MSLVLIPVLILIAALLVFGIVANLDLTSSIITESGIDMGEFLIGTFILMVVFVIVAFALTYRY